MAEVGPGPGIGVAETNALITAALANVSRGQIIYASSGEAIVGLNSNARTSMLPSAQAGSSLMIAANKMPVGYALVVEGTGLIGAMSVGPGSFTLTPHVTPAGGSKTDLAGFSYAPLLGADGICAIRLVYLQTSAGIQTGGETRYGVANGMQYTIPINPGTTGAQPAVIASNPAVDRTFGVDGQWATAATANYVRCRLVTAMLVPLVAAA